MNIKNICNNDTDAERWLINWISSILKTPHCKTGVVPLFIGKSGIGKTTIFLLLKEILGKKYCFETSDLEKDIFGSHSKGRVNKLLVLLDEIAYKQTCKYTEQMKTAFTSLTMSVNPKGIDPYDYDSYENYIGCSNNDIPVELNDDNRRYRVFDVEKANYGTPEEKSEFFKNLYCNVIGSKKDNIKPNYEILKCFYEYMLEFEDKGYILENNVNSTSTLNIARKPIIEEFLNDKIFQIYKYNKSYFTEKETFNISSSTSNISLLLTDDLIFSIIFVLFIYDFFS